MALPVARELGFPGMIRRGRLSKSGTSATLATFRAHFYKLAPTVVNGDGGVFSGSMAAVYLGSMDFDMTGTNARVFTDGVKVVAVPNVGSEITFDTDPTSQNIYAVLEARAAYVPASSETFTLALEVLRD